MIRNILSVITLILVLNCNSQNGLSNLSFEAWSSTFLGSQPNGWFGQTVSQQTNSAQQGSSYVRIVTTNTSSSSYDGLLVLAKVTGTAVNVGAPYSQSPTSLNGFYKTSGLASGDSTYIQTFLLNQGSPVALGQFYGTTNVGSWASFSIPYIYYSGLTPDTIWVVAASNIQGAGGPNAIGSTLDLDNLSFQLAAGIDEHSIGTSFLVYPNPASNELNIFSKDMSATSIIITDVYGKLVDEILLNNEKTQIDLQKYSAGIYMYSILDDQKQRNYLANLWLQNKIYFFTPISFSILRSF